MWIAVGLGTLLVLSVAAGVILPFIKKAEWMIVPLVAWVVVLATMLAVPAMK